jgi:hypothetical protein
MVTDEAIAPPIADNHWDIVPQSALSRHFSLARDGQDVAQLKMAFWTEDCSFTIAGHAFAIRRKSIWKDGFELVTGEQVVCEVKRRFWSQQFEISAIDTIFVLKRAGWFTREFLLSASENVVGRIQATGWFTRRRVADFTNEVPPPVQVLTIFLVLLTESRQNKSAAAGG